MKNWNDAAIYGVIVSVFVVVVVAAAAGGYTMGVKDTIREAQRAAVIAGAARWSSNRETGEAQFDYIQCLNPAGLK